MSRPLVTISIPSYRHARYLGEAIESALSQTYRPLEILVIEDGSRDDSLEIAEEYGRRHPDLVRVYTHDGYRNRGVSATVNLGIEKSRGVYWSGLPSDDVLYPEKTELQVRWLERFPQHAFVYGFADFIDRDGREVGRGFGKDMSLHSDPLEAMILGNSIPGMALLTRREALLRTGLHKEELVYSDWELWIRMVAGWDFGVIHRPLVGYRIHGENLSIGSAQEAKLERSLEVMRSLRSEGPSLGGRLAEDRTLALLDLRCAGFLFESGDTNAAAAFLERALATCPALLREPRTLARWLRVHRRPGLATPPGGMGLPEWVLERLPRRVSPRVERRVRRSLDALDRRSAALRERRRRPVRAAALVLRSFVTDPGYVGELAGRARRRIGGVLRWAIVRLAGRA